jgi:hypothetical protein
MTYYVEVKVTKSVKSYDEAVAFGDKILESTKGEANYSRKIDYVQESDFNRALKTFTINNTTVNNPVDLTRDQILREAISRGIIEVSKT